MNQNQFPDACNPDLVGKYDAMANSGGGYFFDEVLEYRVWCHPERGAPDEFEGDDYFYSFATYAEAIEFAADFPGCEEPLVLIRQREWINEPRPGVFEPQRGERIAEWRPEWLADSARQPGTIEAFLAARQGN